MCVFFCILYVFTFRGVEWVNIVIVRYGTYVVFSCPWYAYVMLYVGVRWGWWAITSLSTFRHVLLPLKHTYMSCYVTSYVAGQKTRLACFWSCCLDVFRLLVVLSLFHVVLVSFLSFFLVSACGWGKKAHVPTKKLKEPDITHQLTEKARQTQLHASTPVAEWFELLSQHHNIRYKSHWDCLKGRGISWLSRLFRLQTAPRLHLYSGSPLKLFVYVRHKRRKNCGGWFLLRYRSIHYHIEFCWLLYTVD